MSIWDTIVDEPTDQGTSPQPEPQDDEVADYLARRSSEQYIASQSPDYVAPVEEYTGAYAEGVPQGVTEAQSQFADISYATQDYANQMQQRIIDDYYGYQNDENYEGMLSRTYTEQSYNYLKRKNNDANDTAWAEPKPEDDFFSVWLPDWISKFDEERQANAKYNQETPTTDQRMIQSVYDQATDAQRAVMDAPNIEHGNWNLMSWWDKAKYLIVPGSNSYTVDDAPQWFTRLAQTILPTAMSAGAGKMAGGIVGGIVGSIVPGAGTIAGAKIGSDIGALAFGGATFLRGMFGIEIPIIGDIQNGMNYLGDKTEQALGTVSAAYNVAKELTDKNDFFSLCKTVGEVLRDPENKYLWEVSKYSYEVGAGTFFDELTNTIYNVGAKASNQIFGTDFEERNIGDVSRNNLGRSGWESTLEDTYGAESLIRTYTPIFTGLVEAAKLNGMDEKQAIEWAHQNMQDYVFNYRGSTGLVNDFVTQAYQDPTNFLPYATAKITQGVGHLTGNKALEAAGKAAAGNPLIDELDPISQPIVEGFLSKIFKNRKGDAPDIFKPYGSQGLDVITRTYANNLIDKPLDSLSKIQRAVAGVDDTGKLKGFEPNKQYGNPVINWAANLFRKTEETKMFEMSEMTTNFIGSLLFEGGGDPTHKAPLWDVPDLVEQITGKVDIPDTSPLKRFENTPILNTLRDGLKGVPEGVIRQISSDVRNYRDYGGYRDTLKFVAEKLKMTPKEIFDALDNKKHGADVPQIQKRNGRKNNVVSNDSLRQELFRRIRNEGITYTDASGKVYNTESVIKAIDKFRGHRQLYSETYMRANVLDKLSTAVDKYNMQRYNIQPDRWWTRMSDLTKSMQSIALLNFSPSYMVNNFLNNLLTRSVTGVGGIDSGFIKTINEERGLKFSRDADTYGSTSRMVSDSKRAHDLLQKFDDLYSDVSESRILRGVNNIDIEGMETRAASDIGMNRYWNATWEMNIPAFPEEWSRLGIDEATQKRIRDIAYDSPNIATFRQKLMSEVAIPGAESVIRNMINNNYDGDMRDVMQDTFAKTPWISMMLDEVLRTNDVTQIHDGMERIREMFTSDIDFKNVVEQEGTYKDLRTRFSGEGLPAVGTAIEVMADMFADIWIKQTKQNGTLFLDRVVGGLSKEEFNKRFLRVLELQSEDYNIARGYAIKMTAAMCDGLGLSDDITLDITMNMMKRFDIAAEQVRQNHEVYESFASPDSPYYDFGYYQKSRIDMLQKTQDATLQADIELNKAMVDYLRATLDPSLSGEIDKYEKMLGDIIDAKRALNESELKDLRSRSDKSGYIRRERTSLAQEKPRTARKQKIYEMQIQAANFLKSLDSAGTGEPTVTRPMTLDDILRLSLILDESQVGSQRAGEFLQHYKDKSKPQKVFEPVVYTNTEVNTSFRDYQRSKMSEMDLQNAQVIYNLGDAVPLGAADTTHQTFVEMANEYKPINPNADVKKAEFVQVKCLPWQTKYGMVEAGVYHNGELIGYKYAGMPETVHARNNDFPVLGMSKANDGTYLVLVHDEVWKIDPKTPRGADFTMYAQENFHPVQPGATPTVQPWGRAALESSQPLREALYFLEKQAVDDLRSARKNGSIFGRMSPEQQDAVTRYIDGSLRPAYSMQRYETQKYGNMMVDMSLLNYNSRYGFDSMLTMLMPYQYWMTRSLMNWGARMISQPKWFANYARLERLIERNKKDVLPTRLEGMIGIPMPNMGDGLGDALYFDPFGVLFPFKQFYEAADYYVGNVRTVTQNAQRVIDEHFWSGKPLNGHIITLEEYEEAMEGRGAIFEAEFAEQQKLDESDTSLTGLATTFLQPNVLVDALIKHSQGKDSNISYSPMYRFGTTIKASGNNTKLQTLTDILGGAMQLPDKAFRKAIGVETDQESNYFDYYMTSLITDMYTMKEISYDDMTRALVEGPGNKVYDEALHRYYQQQAIRQQSGALLTELGQWAGGNKDTSAGQLLGSAIASVFGAKIYSQGERQYREMKDVRQTVLGASQGTVTQGNATKSVNDYTSKLYQQFQDDFPEYAIHNWSYEDDPEERVHKIMVAKTWASYMALPETQRTAVQMGLGDRFTQLFLNKDTRATDYITDEELGQWIRAMQGNDPTFTDADITNPARQAQQIAFYADSVQADYDRYQRDKKKKFPGIDTVEDGYYSTPENLRAKYLEDNPMLQKYWDWNSAAREANPRLAVYMNDRSAQYKYSKGQYDDITQAILGGVNEWTQKQLRNHIENGWAINPSAERTLRKTYASLHTNVPYETWKKSLLK